MGKKGKMSSSEDPNLIGKWQKNDMNRNIDIYVNIARAKAYDKNLINRKKLEDAAINRKRLIYPFLNHLVNERVLTDQDDKKSSSNFLFQQQYTVNYKQIIRKFKQTSVKYQNSIISMIMSIIRGNIERENLSLPCVKCIAKNLMSYDIKDLKHILRYSSKECSEYLSLFGTLYKTINDDNIGLLANENSNILVLGEITDKGINNLCTSFTQSKYYDSEICDCWEDCDISNLDLFSKCFNMNSIILLNSKISIDSLFLLGNQFINLTSLHLHNFPFTNNLNEFDESYCLQILECLSHGFKALESLKFSYCKWINLVAFNRWMQLLIYNRKNNFPELLLLKKIKIIGYKEYHYELETICNPSKESNELIREKIDSECDSIVQEFKDIFSIQLIIQ